MWATILELIKDFLKAIPIIAKYFPPKSLEQSKEEGDAKIDEQIKDEQTSGRPQ
jgi:hypothetical protein